MNNTPQLCLFQPPEALGLARVGCAHMIPAMYEWCRFVVLGGLASYETSLADGF
jgi:hypothetical protein